MTRGLAETGIALRLAERYGLRGLAGVTAATRALSAATRGGRLPLPPIYELLEPVDWPSWLLTYPPAPSWSCDDCDEDRDGSRPGAEDCDAQPLDNDCDDAQPRGLR